MNDRRGEGQELQCDDCHSTDDVGIVLADEGEGASLRVLCDICSWRRHYRAVLEKRRASKRNARRGGAECIHNLPLSGFCLQCRARTWDYLGWSG